MPDQTAQEPTMEEILASIRRIISEDDAPQGEVEADAAPFDDDEEPQDTESADESAAVLQEEIRAPQPAPAAKAEPLVSRETASAAASAFGQLTAAVSTPARQGGGSGQTIDELVRELLQPMLRQWLDQNLPAIVQAAVRDEVERISRGRVG
jgi:cell pole-organizing protein PopZ